MSAQQKIEISPVTVQQTKPQLSAVVDKVAQTSACASMVDSVSKTDSTSTMMPEKDQQTQPSYDFVGIAG